MYRCMSSPQQVQGRALVEAQGAKPSEALRFLAFWKAKLGLKCVTDNASFRENHQCLNVFDTQNRTHPTFRLETVLISS